ncbi:hypothetical protein SAMN05421833_11516 [Microbispora rosea]|uniref:Uncharacterized protein n=1 Tax=Microbispora rosea TaxID=58117 RepID=A0A1N7DLY6_9ACTN|nr:hypothetical protein [Microbispora rosea]GIH49353.1 hypothetical protein Mro03_45320 [Microbispora rosea subsp. rosea]SIR76846.1 hypothetical protein SAMN05421833_11516 [Microbispora rosea]
MLTLRGKFGVEDSAYAKAWKTFQPISNTDAIIADRLTTLDLVTEDAGRQGETYLIIDGRDIDHTVPSVVLVDGVWDAKVVVRIRLHGGLKYPEILESLAHEWGIHAEKGWTFASYIRKTTKLEAMRKYYTELFPPAKSAVDLPDHRLLAEGVHERHRELMFALRKLEPKLADALLAAWQDDIDNYAESARTGRKATASWNVPQASTETTTTQTTAQDTGDDDAPLTDENDRKAFDDWLGEGEGESGGDDTGRQDGDDDDNT